MNIPEELKKLRLSQNLSQSEMASKIGISQQVYSNIENGRNKKISAEIFQFLQENFVIHPKESSIKKSFSIKNIEDYQIPLYLGDTEDRPIEVNSEKPNLNKPFAYLPSNVFPSCNYSERVTGNSMYPQIQNHALIIGKIIDMKGIIYGDIYSIHTKHGLRIVKYLYPSEKKDYIKLISFNKDVPPTDIPIDDITFCCKILYIINPS